MKSAKLWSRLADDFENLPAERFEGRVLTPEEEQRLFAVARTNPDWGVAYCAALIANNTTARGCGIRGLRLRDVDLVNRVIKIRRESTKTAAGVRPLALNSEAHWAAFQLWKRAQALGSCEPDHYLLPYQRQDKTFDPKRHQETWEKAWHKMTKAANLEGLRFHDLRHNANTALAEDPEVSPETRIAIAGHSSLDSNLKYTHPQLKEMRRALERMADRRKQAHAELASKEQKTYEAETSKETVN